MINLTSAIDHKRGCIIIVGALKQEKGVKRATANISEAQSLLTGGACCNVYSMDYRPCSKENFPIGVDRKGQYVEDGGTYENAVRYGE